MYIFFLSGRDQKLVRPHPEIYSYVYIEMESAHLFGFHIGLYNGLLSSLLTGVGETMKIIVGQTV